MPTVVLNPTADNHLRGESPTTNAGTDQLDCGEYNGGSEKRRPCILFDLSSIPYGSIINSATFEIYDTGTDLTDNNRTARFYRLERSWTELGSTWNSRDGTNNWVSPGASSAGAGQDRDTSELGTLSQPNPPSAGYKSVTFNTALVQGWIDGAHPNYGFMMISDTEVNDMHRYVSREGSGGTLAQVPKLTIDYTPPKGGAFLLRML